MQAEDMITSMSHGVVVAMPCDTYSICSAVCHRPTLFLFSEPLVPLTPFLLPL